MASSTKAVQASAWKESSLESPHDALVILMPELAALVDRSRPVVYQEIEAKNLAGTDLIFFDVPIKGDDNKVGCLIAHHYRQGQDFTRRLYEIFVRLRVRYPGRMTVFVIYSDGTDNENSYTETSYGVETTFQFGALHLISRNADRINNDVYSAAQMLFLWPLTNR
jgi:hypothetical protein